MQHRHLETIDVFTPLGVRFWDPVTNSQVADGLNVAARPASNPARRIPSFKTRSGIYAFRNLPGLRRHEQNLPPASPPDRIEFIIEVNDPANRYVDVGFRVPLPLGRGIFPTDFVSTGSPAIAPRGINLYPAATRTAPSMMAVVRGDLIDQLTRLPAANAFVRVITTEGDVWESIADTRGQFAVVLPYPEIEGGLGGSPSIGSGVALADQTWDLLLQVHYEPALVEEIDLVDTTTYSYASILRQAPSTLYADPPETGGVPENDLQLTLEFGRELIANTEGLSELLVNPVGSPP